MSQNNPLQIGITGGIGAGKSIVCQIFGAMGIPTYNADQAARRLMETDEVLIASIKATFGQDAYLTEGKLNRDYLAEKVFSQKESVKTINGLVHPVVGSDYQKWLKRQSTDYVLKEAALLIESKSYKSLDKLISVNAPIDLRVERVRNRDPFRSVEEIHRIISNQLSDEERNSLASHTIQNGATDLLIPQVLELHHEFANGANDN